MVTLPANLRPNANLTNFAIAHSQSKDFEKLLIPGIVPVMKRSDRYLVFSKGDLLRPAMKKRAPGTEAAAAEMSTSYDTYYCDRYAVKRRLTDEDVDEWGSLEAAEEEITRWLTEQSYLTMAQQFAATVMVTGSWGTGVGGLATQTGAASASTNQFIQWDRSSTVPVNDIMQQQRALETSIGRRGSVFFAGNKVIDNMANSTDILSRIQYVQKGVATEDVLASLLGVERVVRLRSMYVSSAEGATVTTAQIASNVSALLGYFSPGATKDSPACAKIFAFQKYGGFPASVPTIRKWFDDDTKSTWYEAEIYFDVKVTAPDAAVFFATAVQAGT